MEQMQWTSYNNKQQSFLNNYVKKMLSGGEYTASTIRDMTDWMKYPAYWTAGKKKI